jgi:hypothetical protein
MGRFSESLCRTVDYEHVAAEQSILFLLRADKADIWPTMLQSLLFDPQRTLGLWLVSYQPFPLTRLTGRCFFGTSEFLEALRILGEFKIARRLPYVSIFHYTTDLSDVFPFDVPSFVLGPLFAR